MTSPNSTLWMGNIEKWMNHTYLYNLLKSANIYPNKIIIKNYKSKRGCAFFDSLNYDSFDITLTEHNNKIVNGVKLQFNWVHSLEQRCNLAKITKFTVRNIFFIF